MGSPFKNRVERFYMRMNEAGMPLHWSKIYGQRLPEGSPRSELVVLTLKHAETAFYMLFVGYGLSIVCIVVELFIQKYRHIKDRV